ncbi:hypothetical protein FAM09_12925 [Niastella caeni]|uniref:Uncharacterized protein n=1 Tax=Niastella caeni TaxID=2569763 RepID=A0A4S8I157_9BACT|nr:hypothetical protein [Niastella caeni]THU39402.1 hypothetical protein FAM09_12925 [Niastella caeni]
MKEKDEVYVALLIINLGGTFSNSYGMCRLLDRKFDIYNCVRVVSDLINESLVDYVEKDGVIYKTAINFRRDQIV